MITLHLHGQKPISVESMAEAEEALEQAMLSAHRQRSCERKVKYGHHATAVKAVEAMQAKGNHGLKPYECRFCDGWHIGHDG